MNYRLYKPADFSALYAVEKLCFEPPFRFSRGLMRKLVANPNSATFVAEEIAVEKEELAGFAIVDWAAIPKGTIAYIQTIEVHPASRRRGIAHELMRLLEDSARAAGATAIWLHVDVENAAAIRLYENHGYARKGREEHFYARQRPAFVYARSISDASGPHHVM